MCSPGLTVDEYFTTAKDWERPIFDAVAPHLESLGDVIIDPIGMGILFKNGPAFCSLRSMTRWTALGFTLGRKLTNERLSRKVSSQNGKHFHVVNVSDPAEIDAEMLDWLSEAYHFAGGTLHLFEAGGGPDDDDAGSMVPDDVEDPFAG